MSKQSSGFGSFHTERDEDRIDVLISRPDSEYSPPSTPIPLDLIYSTLNYPIIPEINPPDIHNLPSLPTLPALNPHFQPRPYSFPPSQSSQSPQPPQATITFGRPTLNALYHLDPSFTFINHGAFGATLRPVSDSERLWHEYMESQPLRFIDRKLLPLLVSTTRRLAKFVHVDAQNVVILPNVTTGLNTVLNSINWYHHPLSSKSSVEGIDANHEKQEQTEKQAEIAESDGKQPEITPSSQAQSQQHITTIETLPTYVITFDTGYGATKQMIKSVQDKFGKHIVHQDLPVSFPVSGDNEIIALFRHNLRKHQKAGTVRQIKLVIIDHVQSNSALVFPVTELVQLCHENNIPVLVDGAHGLGTFDLNISAIKPTFYTANAHKWLCSGKGVSLLYVDPTFHSAIKPAVVSHGYSTETLAGKFTWIGLQDYCHYLGLNTALDLWERIGADNIRTYIHTMIQQIGVFLQSLWNTDLLADPSMFKSMICVRLPGPRVPRDGNEHTDIQDELYFKYNIEVPIKMLQNRLYVRVSCHIYNDWNDYIRFGQAMLAIRPKLEGDDDVKDQVAAEDAALVNPNSGCG